MLLNMVGRNEEDFTNVLKRDGDEDAVVVIQWTLDFGVMAPTVHKPWFSISTRSNCSPKIDRRGPCGSPRPDDLVESGFGWPQTQPRNAQCCWKTLTKTIVCCYQQWSYCNEAGTTWGEVEKTWFRMAFFTVEDYGSYWPGDGRFTVV